MITLPTTHPTTVLYEVSDHIATLTLNRPDRLNAYTAALGAELRQAMRRASDDADVRVIILTGAGRGFCAGADMDTLNGIQGQARDGGNVNEAATGNGPWDANTSPDYQMAHSYFPAVPKPIIAAINGACAGLGLVYALFCDVRFAAAGAKFTTAFSRRGLIAEHGISVTLPRLVGLSKALDLLMSARVVQAEEALRLGMVDHVVAPAELMAAARAYAKDMADNVSPRSMAVIKQQIWAADQLSMRANIEVANQAMLASFASEDFKEGVAHFVQKRPAAFTGR